MKKFENGENAQAVGRDISLERDIGSRVKWGDLVRCGCQAVDYRAFGNVWKKS